VVWSSQFGPDASYRRGRLAVEAVDRDVVLKESARLIETDGYRHKGFLLRGLILARIRRFDEAIPWLEKASMSEPLTIEASTVAARCVYSTGHYVEAVNAANAALMLDDNATEARRWLAAAYYDLGAISQTVVELERISKDAPTDPRPERLLGLIAKDGEQYPMAIGHYEESLKRDAQQSERQNVLVELAESQIKQGQFKEALVTLEKCTGSAIVSTWMADCLSSLGKFEAAHDRLREALEAEPKYFPAKLSQGKLYLDNGQVEEAIQALKQAIEWEPQSSQAHFQLSQALRQLGRAEEADAELHTMREIQKLEREFTDLHDAASNRPADADVRYRIGELAQLLGKPKLPAVWYRAALAINPNHLKARAALEASQQPTANPGRFLQ
jgi:tetratricopeptide (TPR) repeat protein